MEYCTVDFGVSGLAGQGSKIENWQKLELGVELGTVTEQKNVPLLKTDKKRRQNVFVIFRLEKVTGPTR